MGWSIYALVNISGISFQSARFSASMALPIIAESVYFFLITHIYRNLSKKMGWLLLPGTQAVPKVFFSIIFMSVTVYLVRVGVAFLLSLYSSDMLSVINFLGNVTANLIILIIWSSIYFAFHYFEKNTQSLKYEVAMNEMKINQLKAQINPHFIFNALNSIRALVDEEPSKSKQAINHLSNILRSSLVLDKKKLTTLKEELNTTKDYLALESIRFEERLKTEFNIEEETENIQVPPMMLQTLVENGIKHGISQLKDGGTVSVDARIELGSMILEIRNTGQYHNKMDNTGQGLKNSRQRIELIYGESAKLNIENENENTVLTTVKIPINK